MFNVRVLRFLFAALLVMATTVASANVTPYHAVTFIQNDFTHVDLSSSTEILRDPERRLDIHQVITPENQERFRPMGTGGGQIGFTKDTIWVRFTVATNLTEIQALILELDYPMMDKVELFESDGRGGFRKRVAGDTLPFSQRELDYRNITYRINAIPGKEITYYLRFETEGTMQLALVLWDMNKFIEHASNSQVMLGLYFGAIFLLVFSAIGGLIFLRDNLFLWYALYLTAYGLLNLALTGYGFQYLWPSAPGWQASTTGVLVGIAVIAALFFSGRLLDIRQQSLTFYNLFRANAVIAVCAIMLGLFGMARFANQLGSIAGMVLVPVLIAAAVVSYRGGNAAARYFLVAWGIFLIFVFIGGLYFWGLLPHSFVSHYALQIGSIFEVTMLAVALADRVKQISAEKEKADLQAKQYLYSLNENLERMVEERTSELELSNQRLQELASHDSLTNLLNHRAVIDALTSALSLAERYKQPLSVAMIDIDHFKQVNDVFGHQAGDEVLTQVAQIFRTRLRAADISGRYGGEEFLLIMPQTQAVESDVLMNRLRQTISTLSIPIIGEKPITVSIGLVSYQGEGKITAIQLVTCADAALYQAKANGRNRVEWGRLETITGQALTKTVNAVGKPPLH